MLHFSISCPCFQAINFCIPCRQLFRRHAQENVEGEKLPFQIRGRSPWPVLFRSGSGFHIVGAVELARTVSFEGGSRIVRGGTAVANEAAFVLFGVVPVQ